MSVIYISEFRNAEFLENGWIDCEINHPSLGWIPFTADPKDTGAQFDVQEFHDRMVASGTVAPYIRPPQEELDRIKAAELRAVRDELLKVVVDPIVSNPLRWAELSAEKQAEWVAYRRALLDLPLQLGFPNDGVWPTVPQ